MPANGERTRVVDAIRGEFGLAACLKAVGLKRGTYYYERSAIAAGDRYAVLRARVAGLFEQGCVCSIESGPCERVDVFHVSGRFWSTSACGEKRTPARPAWTSFPS